MVHFGEEVWGTPRAGHPLVRVWVELYINFTLYRLFRGRCWPTDIFVERSATSDVTSLGRGCTLGWYLAHGFDFETSTWFCIIVLL